jgi:DNA-directed DNA polymerase III PolC
LRTLVHLDADAFFAAVEQASDPKLRGKPVAVGGEKRGIIASASYEARQFGVFTPMPTVRARKLCPKLIILPGDFERYEQFSNWMFGYCYDFTPDVEQTSIDEGYFDLSAARKPAVEIALTIRQAIGQRLKITVSEGIGTNKLVSAVASKLTKPAAFNQIPPGHEAAFLHPLPNQWLPGIGPKTSARLNAAGLAQIRHVAATPLDMLALLLGSQAATIRQFAHGIDERPLIPAREPQKSFSQQETFASDLTDEGYVEAILRRMADHLFAAVRDERRSVRTLTVRVRYNDMAEDQVSESLVEPTDLETDVYGRLHKMLRAAWKRRVSLRLVSLKLSNVYDGRFRSELPLEISAQRQDAQARLARVIDELRKSRGHSVLLRGHDFRLREAPVEIGGGLHAFDKSNAPVRCSVPSPSPWPSPQGEGIAVAAAEKSTASSGGPGWKSILPLHERPPLPLRGGEGTGEGDVQGFNGRMPSANSLPKEEGRCEGKGGEHASVVPALSEALESQNCILQDAPKGEGVGQSQSVADYKSAIRQTASLRYGTDSAKRAIRNRSEPPHAGCYIPLRARSHYSFLDSTLSPTAIVELAKWHGLPAVALTDFGNLHGAVEFVSAAKEAGVKPILGAELRVEGKPLLLYVESARGYHNLCRLLSEKAEGKNGSAPLTPSLSPRRGEGVRRTGDGYRSNSRNREAGSNSELLNGRQNEEGSVVRRQRASIPSTFLRYHAALLGGLVAVSDDARLAELFPGRFYRLVTAREMPADFPAVAAPAIHYAVPEDRQKYDIVQSIRTLTLLREKHPEKRLGGRLHFRTPREMASACQAHPDWLRHTLEIAERCNFDFPFGKPQFPAFTPSDGSTSSEFLRRLVHRGLEERYGHFSEHASGARGQVAGVTHYASRFTDHASRITQSQIANLKSQVETELSIITDVGYEEYFLITWDFLQECRRRSIEWITRGSAADSLVCYCLGISSVCPIRFDLYFRRFLNKERMALHKLPDIDIDFAHDFKDDVVKLIFEKYGPEHCAVVGGFSTFQARSAFAEVAKVLGVAEREVRKFTEHFPWSFGGGWVPDEPTPSGGDGLIEMLRASPENRDLPLDEEPYKTALQMAEFLDGVPRYPKMHPCGLVLSRQPMHELTPTFISSKGCPTTHFDMDAVEAVGLVKMDILAQGGLAAMRDVKAMLDKRGIEIDLERCVARDQASGELLLGDPHAPEPWRDPQVWDLIAGGHARAVHHIESPAMTSLSRMCNVREIDGLIAIVSVIRPGAANEGKKLAFTRRYQGMEPVTYPHPSLEACLRSTYGLVVYEEHILQLCEAFAGLEPGRADVLRRALNKQKRRVIEEIRGEFFASARARGHTPEKTAEVWDLVAGFAGYAFCKAHSTAYGVEAYQSAWLKRYFPAEFMAAVLANGKGFYDPLVYVLECHRLGLTLLPPSVNEPGPEFKVELGSTHGLACFDRRLAGRMECVGHSVNDALFDRAIEVGEGAGHGTRGRVRSPAIRVPLTRMKGLTARTAEALLAAREEGPFTSMDDFFRRVVPTGEELEAMIRAGAFDEFGETRTRQFWQAQHLLKNAECGMRNAEFNFSEPTGLPSSFSLLPSAFLPEPTRRECLQWETDLFGFVVSGHPLELFDDVAWDTYCPVNRLGEFVGQTVITCGLVVEQRIHHQTTGEPMKFLTLADWTGMVETELFAQTYKSYGLATVRYPVLEIEAKVEPFENGRGFSLRVLRAGKPRTMVG